MPSSRKTVLLTRPRAASEDFAADLRGRLGPDVRILVAPVLEIVPVGDIPDLSPYGTLIFTSAHAVERLGAAPVGMPAYCVGDRTAAAAARAGLAAISADGDAEALARRLLHDRPPAPWLHLRGAHGTGDLAARLTAAGCPTDAAVTYRQDACRLGAEALDVLRSGMPVIAPVFSPRSAGVLAAALPADAAPPLIVAISAAAARAWNGTASRTVIAPHPGRTGMLDAVAAVANSDSPC